MTNYLMYVIGGIGVFTCLTGMFVIIWSLSMSPFIYELYMALGVIILAIGVGIIYGGSKLNKKSVYICGFCNYVADTEMDLYNHSLQHEKQNK